MLRNCNNCHKEFSVYPAEIKKGGDKYCSQECYKTRNGKEQTVNCLICQKPFTVTPSNLKRGGGKYCSLTCLRQAQASKPAYNANAVLVNCLVCQKEFKVIPAKLKVGKGKFCSKVCYLANHSKGAISHAICKGCGKEFEYPTWQHKTCCSLSCNMKWRIKLQDLDKRIKVNCQQCKKEFLVRAYKSAVGRGKYCSRECYGMWMSENLIGDESPAWQGGVTTIQRSIRRLFKYSLWVRQIRIRDRVCVLCGSSTNLHVDHFPISFAQLLINYNITDTHEAVMCKSLWDINNGRLLCQTCHLSTDSYAKKPSK